MQAPSGRAPRAALARPRYAGVWDRAIIALFLLAIGVPGLATLAGVDRDVVEAENRTLAPFPALGLDAATLRALPDGFTRYFEDHFAFRTTLVQWQAQIRLGVLHASPSPSVLVGRERWLYYADDGSIPDFAGVPPFSDAELERWRLTLEHNQNWLAARGIAYLFVIAPDKHVIYPEHMPPGVRRLSTTSRIDQLVRYLAARSSVNVLDLRPALGEAKTRERVYHLTDTHWNERGAFVGYEQIAARLQRMVPSIRPLPRSAFTPFVERQPGRDLARMVGLGATLEEEELKLAPRLPVCAHRADGGVALDAARVVTECGTPGLPRAVVFRDSFATALIPFLSENFSRAVYLWERDLDPAVILDERPDVVIHEWVGRHLSTNEPYDALGFSRFSGFAGF